jgi:hypothetical protein
MGACDLELLTEDEHRRVMKRLSAAGWQPREPVDIGPPERPELLLAAVASLPEADSSISLLADGLGLPEDQRRRMLSLPEAHDDTHRGQVVQLRSSA